MLICEGFNPTSGTRLNDTRPGAFGLRGHFYLSPPLLIDFNSKLVGPPGIEKDTRRIENIPNYLKKNEFNDKNEA